METANTIVPKINAILDFRYTLTKFSFAYVGDKETITLFCHGTEKRENGVRKKDLGLGSSGYFYPSIEVKCENKEFFHEGTKIEIEKMYAATCRRIQEPLIIREEKSDCSNGLGADGRSDELESITLVKVGWKFSEEFEEQVNFSKHT